MIAALSALNLLGALPVALLLALKVATGVLVYCGVVMALWFVAGRPDGAEQYFIDKLGLKNRLRKQVK